MLNNIEENKVENVNAMEVKDYEVLTNNNVRAVPDTEVSIVQEEVKEEKKKPYTFRKLNATDIGIMVRLIKKIDINKIRNIFKKEELMEIISKNKDNDEKSSTKEENDSLIMKVGIDIVMELVPLVLDSYSLCENEIFELLSNTSNLTTEEVKTLDLNIFSQMLFDFFKKEEFMGFLKPVLKLMDLA